MVVGGYLARNSSPVLSEVLRLSRYLDHRQT